MSFPSRRNVRPDTFCQLVEYLRSVFDGVPSLRDAEAAYQIGRLHLDGVSRRWEERGEQGRELAGLLALGSVTLD
jgi:hypothetical protein